MSTLRQLLSWGSETLERAEVPDSGQDAWMLMEEVFGIEKSYYAGMSVIRCMYRKRLYFAELAGRM